MSSAKSDQVKTSSPKNTRHRRFGRFILALIPVALILVFAGYSWDNRNLMLPHLYVGDVAVGGLTPVAAKDRLIAAVTSLDSWSVTVDQDKAIVVPLTKLGPTYDIDGMVASAQTYGQDNNAWHWIVRHLKALFVRQTVPVLVTVDPAVMRTGLQENLYQKVDNQATEVSLSIVHNQVKIVDGTTGMVVDRTAVEVATNDRLHRLAANPLVLQRQPFAPEFTVADAALAKTQAEKIIASPLSLTWEGGAATIDQTQLASFISVSGASQTDPRYSSAIQAGATAKARLLLVDLSTDKIAAWLETQRPTIERPPVNALVQFTNGSLSILAAGKSGLMMDAAATAAAIRDALLKRGNGIVLASLAVVTSQQAPTVSENNLTNLGIKELIGKAASDYSGSSTNRKINIALGVSKINGTIVQPNDEFSIVKAIGDIDAAHGFLSEKVLLNNAIKFDFGGGLCQPATTLFRAILDAGLPVTQRTNHSRRVSYYEQPISVKGVRLNWDATYANIGSNLVGYDATIYDPEPDLRFRNDTGHAVLVQAYVTDNHMVTFELYGTNDGRQVTVSKAAVLATYEPGPTINDSDASKPVGTRVVIENPVPGAKTAFDYTITYPDGHKKTENFDSYFAPVAGHYINGTAPAPAVDTPVQ